MKQRVLAIIAAPGMILWALGCSGSTDTSPADPPANASPSTVELGELLYPAPALSEPASAHPAGGASADPIVIPDCRLTVLDKQEIPSQREGVLLFIGTEIPPGEELPADRRIVVRHGGEEKTYRKLKEGDRVEPGQLLAQLDDRLARDDRAIKAGKVKAAKADFSSAEKTRDEARSRYERQTRLRITSATSEEELRAAKLTWERYIYEATSKAEAVGLAELELSQAETVLAMHQIRSSIPGTIKNIYKKRGESVRNLEPVFQLHDFSRLRAEGLLEVEYLPRLRTGMTSVVEPVCPEGPEQTLLGNLHEITSVAVARGRDGALIVSAGEDGSVRVWDRSSGQQRRVLWHSVPVRCVACTLPAATGCWCLTGTADGNARLWDLDSSSEEPVRAFQGQHKGPVTCVAFSPDGRWCATGGNDHDICLWNAASGDFCYRFPSGHRAALTALHFTPQSQLVSAGRDNTVRVWTVGKLGARLDTTLDCRSGEVAQPGVSPDGRYVLLDQGRALRMLTLRDRRTACVLENPAEASQFTTFALFSPDSRLILTAGGAEGRLQLWHAPTATTRAYELWQMVARDRGNITCAAFSPDGTFVAAGTEGRQVLVWPLPNTQEIEQQRKAELSLVEHSVDTSARQVRVWAEIANSDGRLLPGGTVTLSIYPPRK